MELEEKRNHMEALIQTVEQTIRSMKGEYDMSDQEKFQAFKERVVRENEEKTRGGNPRKNMAMKRWMPQTGKF